MKIRVVCGALGLATGVIVLGQMNVGAAPDAGVIKDATTAGTQGGSLDFPGADVTYQDCQSVGEYGGVGGIQGYALGSYTCNIGDEDLWWGNTWNGTPGLAMNAYMLKGGRLIQIGMSWVKHACCAAAGNGCGGCNGHGGSVLGVGCRDIYSSGWNGGQSRLGPRSDLNPYTGAFIPAPGGTGNAIFKRLQIAEGDLQVPSATYFVEGVYVAADEVVNGDHRAQLNNASFKEVIVSGFDITPIGAMDIGRAAIYAWRDHPNGDPSVRIVEVDVPDEGRFIVASKVTDLGGTWMYDYAVFNLNSDVAGGSFTVPVPSGAQVSGVGFNDVDYHSGEIYDNTDWNSTVAATSVSWTSPEPFSTNQNSNALRWGTQYNYWFQSDAAPGTVNADLGLFKPHTPSSVPVSVVGPMTGPSCPADVNGDNVVDVLDLIAVLTVWGPCPGCPEDINNDDVVDVLDLIELLTNWGPCP